MHITRRFHRCDLSIYIQIIISRKLYNVCCTVLISISYMLFTITVGILHTMYSIIILYNKYVKISY